MKTQYCAVLLLAAAAANAGDSKVYTWVDEQGVTHYASSAEEAAKAAEVERLNLEKVDSVSVVDTETPQPAEAAEATDQSN